MGRKRSCAVLAVSLMLVAVAPFVGAGTAVAQEQFRGILSGRQAFTIRIRAYTSDDEAERLLRLLKDQGARAVQDELAGRDLARFQLNGQGGGNIGFARSTPTDDGGRIIRLIASPFIGGADRGGAYVGPGPRLIRSDEIFVIIDLRLNEHGTGTGEFFAAAQIGLDPDGKIEIEPDARFRRITMLEVQ